MTECSFCMNESDMLLTLDYFPNVNPKRLAPQEHSKANECFAIYLCSECITKVKIVKQGNQYIPQGPAFLGMEGIMYGLHQNHRRFIDNLVLDKDGSQ